MRRWFPRIALLLVGLAAIALAGLGYLVSNLDLVALEAQLALAVRERTGHDLRVEDVGLRLLPQPGLELSGLELSAAPGFGPAPLARVEHARARLRLRPLLVRGELELGTVVLEGLALELERSASGRGSWETLVEHLHALPNAPGAATLPPIARISLVDARLSFEDRASGRAVDLDALQLRLGPLGTAELPLLEIAGRLRSRDPALDSDFVLVTPIDTGHEGSSLALEDLHLELLGQALDASVRVAPGEEGTTVEGWLRVPSLDLRALAAGLGRSIAPGAPSALARGSLATHYRWDGSALRLDELRWVVDESTVTGAAILAGLEPPAVWADLSVDRLDLDCYAPFFGARGAAPRVPALPAGLRYANVEGRLRVGQLSSGGLDLQQVSLPVSLVGNTLEVSDASAGLLGGEVQVSARAHLDGVVPAYGLQARVWSLDLARLLAATGSSREMTGSLGLELDLAAAGAHREALLEALVGQLCVELSDGEMPLADRPLPAREREGDRHWQLRRVERQLGLIQQQLVAHAQEKLDARRPERLVYSRIGACFLVDDSVARSDDVRVVAEGMDLAGAGVLDLAEPSVEMALVLSLEGLPPMDLRISGPLDDPQVDLDKPGAMDVARHRVGLRRDELRDGLRERKGEGVDRLVDHREQVLERREELRDQAQEARQGLRDQIRGTRQALRDGRRGDAEGDASEEPSPALEPDVSSQP